MKKNIIVILLIALLLVSGTSCSASSTKQEEELYENYQPSASSTFQNTFTYSSDQITVRQEFGIPTRFTIVFNKDKRHESWYFDTAGYTVAFIDGVKVSEKHTMPEYRQEMYATTLSPDQFDKGMGIDEILLSTGKDEFILTTMEEGVTENGQLMYLEGLSVGLMNGQINFVETYPAMTERKLIAADFNIPQISELTPEEIASEGLHEYQVDLYMDGELFDSYISMIDVRFADDKVCLTENNESGCFLRIGENEFFAEDNGIIMILVPDGFVLDLVGENGEIQSLFSRIDD